MTKIINLLIAINCTVPHIELTLSLTICLYIAILISQLNWRIVS